MINIYLFIASHYNIIKYQEAWKCLKKIEKKPKNPEPALGVLKMFVTTVTIA